MTPHDILRQHGGDKQADCLGVSFDEFVKAAELSNQINNMVRKNEITGQNELSIYIDALPVEPILKVHIAFSIVRSNPLLFI